MNSESNKNINPEPTVSLILSVGRILELYVGASARDEFLKNPIISMSMNYPDPIQRVIINRYFIETLISWRSKSNIPVVDILPCLCDDGDIKYWLELFMNVVLPFLRDKNILGIPMSVK